MSSVASTLKERLGPPHLGHLLNTLLAGLYGRTWTGKEALLQAIDTVCTYCRSVDKASQLKTVIVRGLSRSTVYCKSSYNRSAVYNVLSLSVDREDQLYTTVVDKAGQLYRNILAHYWTNCTNVRYNTCLFIISGKHYRMSQTRNNLQSPRYTQLLCKTSGAITVILCDSIYLFIWSSFSCVRLLRQ